MEIDPLEERPPTKEERESMTQNVEDLHARLKELSPSLTHRIIVCVELLEKEIESAPRHTHLDLYRAVLTALEYVTFLGHIKL